MKHKIRIKSAKPYPRIDGRYNFWRWYAFCACGWEPRNVSPATGLFARPSMDAALAVGIAHQKENQ